MTRKLLKGNNEIVIFDRCEKMQFEHKQKFYNNQVEYIIGDIRDYEAIRKALIGVDVCIHAGAMKHIDKCETNPEECMKTNINGSVNVINACIENRVKKLICLSTDKATNPSTIYGCSKLFMEMYCQCVDNKDTEIIRTRYGNVLGSNGSVLQIWQKLKEEGKPLTVTNPNTTRFFMTMSEAIGLVQYSIDNGKHDDLIVYNNKACTIQELADCISDNQVVTGFRCEEKTDEALLTINELEHSHKPIDYNLIIVNKDKNGFKYDKPLTSDIAERFSKEELKNMIERL